MSDDGVSPQEQEDREAFRARHYNATVTRIIDVHPELRILRLVPDGGVPAFAPGQFTVLGLEHAERQRRRLLRRAYSISCSILDETGALQPPDAFNYLEFYIVLIDGEDGHVPALTPMLFGLGEGDRLHIGRKITGRYTLDPVAPDDTCVFVATGTGEAPHNAMIAHLLAHGHRGPIVSAVGAHYRRDLAYLRVHQELERRYPNYVYLPRTTREPENVDPSVTDYVGRQHMQDYIASGRLERDAGVELDPGHTHVFLCGNPGMIGAPRYHEGEPQYPPPRGAVEVLVERGFTPDGPRRTGNVHFERYW